MTMPRRHVRCVPRSVWTLFALLLLAGCDSSPHDGPANRDLPSNPSPVFTHHLTDLDKIRGIVPLGSISGGTIAEKSYLMNKTGPNGEPLEIPVYAPVDMHLTELAYRAGQADGEYLLLFQVSREVRIRLDHITDPVDAIRDVGPDSPGNSTITSPPSDDVHLEAGDLVGHTTITTPSGSWDFGLTNTTVENEFVNMERYRSDEALGPLEADCPYEYLEPSLQPEDEALYGLQSGTPYAGATCRSASRDVPGTLAGAWFPDRDVSGGLEYGVVIARDFDGEIRIGGLAEGQLFIPPDPEPPVAPEAVEVGEEICYHDPEFDHYAYFRVVSDMEVEVSADRGACPATFPSGNADTYYR